jgi:hypothetical protein
VEHRAAARQTGIGARQQIDPDASLESMIGPQSFDNHNAPLQPVKAARVNDGALAFSMPATTMLIGTRQPRCVVSAKGAEGPVIALGQRK